MTKSKNWLPQSIPNRSIDCNALALRIYVHLNRLSRFLPYFSSPGPCVECCLVYVDYWLISIQNFFQLI